MLFGSGRGHVLAVYLFDGCVCVCVCVVFQGGVLSCRRDESEMKRWLGEKRVPIGDVLVAGASQG